MSKPFFTAEDADLHVCLTKQISTYAPEIGNTEYISIRQANAKVATLQAKLKLAEDAFENALGEFADTQPSESYRAESMARILETALAKLRDSLP